MHSPDIGFGELDGAQAAPAGAGGAVAAPVAPPVRLGRLGADRWLMTITLAVGAAGDTRLPPPPRPGLGCSELRRLDWPELPAGGVAPAAEPAERDW